MTLYRSIECKIQDHHDCDDDECECTCHAEHKRDDHPSLSAYERNGGSEGLNRLNQR
jgi:hypothetical protein